MKRRLGLSSKDSQLVSILFAMFLHGLALIFIHPASPTKAPIPIKPVNIVFTPKPKPMVHPEQNSGVATGHRASSTQSAAVKSKGNPYRRSASKSYEGLLPKAAELEQSNIITEQKEGLKDGISSSNQRWKEGLEIEAKRVLLRRSAQVFATLDLPLGARLSGIKGQATATLKFDPNQRDMILESLQGLPILRAALYEAFLKPENLAILVEILKALDESTLKVTLQAVTRYERKPNDDSFRWNGNRLVIYTTVAHDAIEMIVGEEGKPMSFV